MKLPKGWRKLQRHERLKKNDRPMYGDGSAAAYAVAPNEVGLTVAASGYFNVCRKRVPKE